MIPLGELVRGRHRSPPHRRQNAEGEAEERAPLVDEIDGGGHGDVTAGDLADLACTRLGTSPVADVQAASVKKWPLAHPRFRLHFTPTSSSWPNLVERWFAELTQKKLKRGVHRCVQALERGIRAWLTDWNENPRPFHWTKTADEILDEVAAYCGRISDSDH